MPFVTSHEWRCNVVYVFLVSTQLDKYAATILASKIKIHNFDTHRDSVAAGERAKPYVVRGNALLNPEFPFNCLTIVNAISRKYP
jgi:hypothetical protein